MDRNKKLLYNTITPLFVQIITIISGLVLPRIRLSEYGSEVNGLVNSISQFLGVISFLELGVGAVVKSALYKPLANNDKEEIDKIMSAAKRFFSKLGRVLIGYVIFLCIVFPVIVNSKYGKGYIIVLIIASSISLFAQYYFGIVCRLLLTADQKIYLQYILQALQIILNFVSWVWLISIDAPIQIAVFFSSLSFLVAPVYMYFYVKKTYGINFSVSSNEKVLKQQWNGIAQHIAAIVLDSTDVVVLSLFSTLASVSVYSVYQMVVYNINSLFLAAMNGVQSFLGELWVKHETESLNNFFNKVEWLTHTTTIFIFGVVSNLLVPFVMIYTKGIIDVQYYQPIFSILLVFAYIFYSLKNPYNVMILAANKYKDTQHIFIIAAAINLVVSIIFVKIGGLCGVAVGTIVAMLYELISMERYVSKFLLNRSLKAFSKQLMVDFICFVIGWILTYTIMLEKMSFISWIFLACKHMLCWAIVCIGVNIIFYRKDKIVPLLCQIKNVNNSRKGV